MIMSFFFPHEQNSDKALYEHATTLLQLIHQALSNQKAQLQLLENELTALLPSKNDLELRFEAIEKQFRPLQLQKENVIIQTQLKLKPTPLTTEENQRWETLLSEKNKIEIQLMKLKRLREEIDLLRQEIKENTTKIDQAQYKYDEAIARREQAREFRHY
jgi:chromosome segregation ATPase